MNKEHFSGSKLLIEDEKHSCFSDGISLLLSAIDSIHVSELSSESNATSQIRKQIEEVMTQWTDKAFFTAEIPPGRFRANYQIDYQLRLKSDDCKMSHLLIVELAFDNRQAIGTNLLKLEGSSHQFVSRTGGTALSIIVAPSLATKKMGFWDSAVATDDEYSWAIRKAYSDSIKCPILLVAI